MTSMPFARNLKISMGHTLSPAGIGANSEGSVLKVDGDWRYIKWDNGVKTWHRVEQLTAQARRKAAEVAPKAVKPRPARNRKGVSPGVVAALLRLPDAD